MSGVVQKQVLFNRILQGVEYRLSDLCAFVVNITEKLVMVPMKQVNK